MITSLSYFYANSSLNSEHLVIPSERSECMGIPDGQRPGDDELVLMNRWLGKSFMANLEITNPKGTSQKAPLESVLSYLRARRVVPYVRGQSVLDFGCGSHLKTLRMIRNVIDCGYGIDILFQNQKPQRSQDGFTIVGSFSDLDRKFDRVLSLACFEHMEVSEFRNILVELDLVTYDKSLIIGTVPTPAAKPVLEWLSFKLGLIDESQIRDHKVYYDRSYLTETINGTGWMIDRYHKFQMGLNGFFVLKKKGV